MLQQLIIGASQQKRKKVVDIYTLRGYSIRKLNSSYNGYCMEVRRSSDNTTLNIGFRNGVLDTVTLLSFVGTGSGYVRTWYDQSYNQINAVQTDNASQPRIVLSGVLDTQNGLPAIYFYNTWLVLDAAIEGDTDFSVFSVLSRTEGATNAFGIATSVVGANGPYSIHLYQDKVYCCNTRMSSYINLKQNSPALYTNIAVNYVNHLYINSEAKTLTNPGGKFPYDFNLIGKRGNDLMDGYNQELLWWASDKSTDRSLIESNIMNFYFAEVPEGEEVNTFIEATGITDETIIDAIQTLHDDLVTYGIWDKCKAIYPFVGGTANTHKYNLKDPRNHDDAFRLVFYGGFTHSANGILGDGSTGWADTYFQPNVNLLVSSQHLSYYSRTNNNSSNKEEMGVYATYQTSLAIKFSGTLYAPIGAASPSVSNSDSSGFFIASKYESGKVSAYRNSSKIINEASSGDGNVRQGLKIALFAWNNNGAIQRFTDRQCAFASIGEGLTPTEAGNFYTAVQAFQTALGRNV